MALNIIKTTDAIQINQVKIMLYGQPGVGKTSCGFTADAPFLFDFDKGAHRSDFRKDSLRIESFSEVSNVGAIADDLKPYKTIIIDTIGQCLEYIIADMLKTDPKLGRKDGAPTMQGYGTLKTIFSKWIKQLMLLNKDIIMISHDKEDKDGDFRIVRPDITGGSYNIITREADFIGYMYKKDELSILNFNPTEKSIGKNSSDFKAIQIPDFKTIPDFFSQVIAKMKTNLGNSANAQLESKRLIESYTEKMNSFKNADDYNQMLLDCRALYNKNMKIEAQQIMSLMEKNAEKINCYYHAEEKKFFTKAPEPKPEPVIEPVVEPVVEPALVIKEEPKITEVFPF